MAKQRIRPDFSQLVAHFTTDREPYGLEGEEDERKGLLRGDALTKLTQILSDQQIWATKMPHTDQRAICFTECT